MKKALFYLGDLRFSIVLFLVFAFFNAFATFIESSYNTATAWALVYDANYFAIIELLLGINVAVGLFKYKMFSEKKIPSLVFHLAFIFILVGAAFTRYGGFEGSIHIREGQSSNTVRTDRSYIWAASLKDGKIYSKDMYKYISELGFLNDFTLTLPVGEKKAVISYEKYLIDAKKVFIEDKDAKPLLALMLAKLGKPGQELVLKAGDIYDIDGIHIGFLSKELYPPYININKDLQLESDFDLKYMSMSDAKSSMLPANTPVNAKLARLYTIKDFNMVVKFVSMNAKEELKGLDFKSDEHFTSWFARTCMESFRASLIALFGETNKWPSILNPLKSFANSDKYSNPIIAQNAVNILKLKLKYDGKSKDVFLLENDKPQKIELDNQSFFLRWGPNIKELPFMLSLKDFELARYAGSNSPSSYASYVRVSELKNDKATSSKEDNKSVSNDKNNFDFKIYMNHVLDHDGYRFYQSSYDQDEKGTILSVNKDPGKLLTYIGYTLLLAGMFFNLLNPYSRFQKLAKLINEDALKTFAVFFLLCFSLVFTPKIHASEELLNQKLKMSSEHIKMLQSLVVQKMSGRMVPFNTLASEVMEKIYGKKDFAGIKPENSFLLMMLDYETWSKLDILKLSRNQAVNDKICEYLGVKPAKYLSFSVFFDKQGEYKLKKYIENANRKSPSSRGVLDKALLKIDERVNILNMIFSGDLLRIIPKQNDPNNTWLGPVRAMFSLKGAEKKEVEELLRVYFTDLGVAISSGDYKKADLALDKIKAYQGKYGSAIMIPNSKLNAEIFANKYQIFIMLAPLYLIAGLLLLALIFIKILTPKIKIGKIVKIAYVFNILIFIILCAGMGLRWYIAGRAPWSNSYESMLFIAWSLSLSGIFFAKKSPISLSLTSILAGVVLGVAHLSQMDPQITNLVPVLQSYWLTIHVSVITASYGFLGLSMLLGAFVLILFCFLNPKNDRFENMMKNITEATRINEMSMILGISLLTAGNFLGAVWANESWGRYWSWDAKEVWTLISILIYAAILHLRLVPSLAKQYNFAVGSMFAYWSVIMTYFGVNYFLAGMHSYAQGGVAKIPSSVYYTFLFMLVLSLVSYFKRRYSKRM